MSKTLWSKYMHIERMDSEEVEGLLEQETIWIEPKIDGANASILMDSDGIIRFAKRSQVIGAGQDFRGLAEWVFVNQDKFIKFFTKYPNHIIYGEWLIPHTIKFYRTSAWKKFYAFDIFDYNTQLFYSPDKRIEMLNEFEINQITPLAKIDGRSLITGSGTKALEQYIDTNKYLIDEPDKVGEGIVIKAFTGDKPYVNKYGRTTWGKVVRQEFKEQNGLAFGVREMEIVFIDRFVTPARIEKIKQKIMTEKGTGWQSSYIPEILGRVYYDIFSEELWNFLKKEKVSVIDFKVLNKLCVLQTKKILGL